MKNNEFRKAIAILYPEASFKFEAGSTVYAAYGEFANSHLSLSGFKDSEYIHVYVNGEPSEHHYAPDVLSEQQPDPFTAEQQQLEQVRSTIKALRSAATPVPHKADSRTTAYLEGAKNERDLILTMLEEILNVD